MPGSSTVGHIGIMPNTFNNHRCAPVLSPVLCGIPQSPQFAKPSPQPLFHQAVGQSTAAVACYLVMCLL